MGLQFIRIEIEDVDRDRITIIDPEDTGVKPGIALGMVLTVEIRGGIETDHTVGIEDKGPGQFQETKVEKIGSP